MSLLNKFLLEDLEVAQPDDVDPNGEMLIEEDDDTVDMTNEDDGVDMEETEPSGDPVMSEAVNSVLDLLYESSELEVLQGLLDEDVQSASLSEAGYTTSLIRITKQQKIQRLRDQAAFVMAKEAKDPMYTKLKKYNAMRKILKAKIRAKYKAKAAAKVREYLSRRGIEEQDN